MSMVAFYPWLAIDERLSVGRFDLLPWNREDQDPRFWDAETQATLDALLAPFMRTPTSPIRRAVVVQGAARGPLEDLDEEARAEFFDLNELVTFSGLAARRFFIDTGYCNATNFTPVVQGFTEVGNGTVIRTRRRDGHTDIRIPGRWHREEVPPHVFLGASVGIDVNLLSGLVGARDEEGWAPYGLSIPLFNRANTDGTTMPERAELILAVCAFERLLDSEANERDLATKFHGGLPVRAPRSIAQCERIHERDRQRASIREVWMRDLFRTRGSLAHGHSERANRAMWEQREHLLLAAFVFPLLVKHCLATTGRYALTEDDVVGTESFERLASIHPFDAAGAEADDENDARHASWNSTIADTGLELIAERLYEAVRTADAGLTTPGTE